MKTLSLGEQVTAVFQGWLLKNAVRQENVNTVQRLATPELFEKLSESMVAKIMTVACQKASKMKPSGNSEIILEHLLHNGGVLSVYCVNTTISFNTEKPSLGILGYKWMQMAVDCNAVHDNLKYIMLRQSIHNHDLNANIYGHELSESILAKWPDYFLHQQHYSRVRNQIWQHITEKGSDTLLRLLIEITPNDYIKIDYLKNLHKRDDYPLPLSVETLDALHQKGFTTERLMNLWITGKETSNINIKDLEGYLDYNRILVENIRKLEQFSITQQRQRLLDETDKFSCAEYTNVKPRKM